MPATNLKHGKGIIHPPVFAQFCDFQASVTTKGCPTASMVHRGALPCGLRDRPSPAVDLTEARQRAQSVAPLPGPSHELEELGAEKNGGWFVVENFPPKKTVENIVVFMYW